MPNGRKEISFICILNNADTAMCPNSWSSENNTEHIKAVLLENKTSVRRDTKK
jgi:hypothetical protein